MSVILETMLIVQICQSKIAQCFCAGKYPEDVLDTLESSQKKVHVHFKHHHDALLHTNHHSILCTSVHLIINF